MPLEPGTLLGPYEIGDPIGAGGMGDVYRARDTRLNRTVAIKTSKKQFDERFDREARAIAALNHPRICALYDVGPDYLVMELVEGKPLHGPLSLNDVLRYSLQIVDALDAAHRKGIVHRDLKPQNILVTKQGVKLLDFGLAKQVTAAASATAAQDATLTRALTGEGMTLGTPQYMAPEQIEGKEADSRTDIFGFGCVLYEMLTGKRAFEAKSHASVIAKILEGEPTPVREVQPVTPPALERVLKTCLAKDPDARWQSAADLKFALQVAFDQSGPPAPPPVRNRRPWLSPVVAAMVAALAAAGGWLARAPEPSAQFEFAVNAPPDSDFMSAGTNAGNSAISPDGTMLAFSARSKGKMQIWIRRLNSIVSQPLPGTEDGYYPFWSPDSRKLGFFAQSKLKTVDLAGGVTQTLCDAQPGRGGTWNADGVILFSGSLRNRNLSRISSSGGTPVPVTELAEGENAHYWPFFLPDGRQFLYSTRSSTDGKGGIWVAGLDSPRNRKRLADGLSNAVYAPPPDRSLIGGDIGHLLYVRNHVLLAQSFDASTRELKGDAFQVAESISFAPNIFLADFSVSSVGTLAYGSGISGLRRLVWRDRTGKELGVFGRVGEYAMGGHRLSRDGKRVAFSLREAGTGTSDVWVGEFERGTISRLSFEKSTIQTGFPVWTADGDLIFYRAEDAIYKRRSTGVGASEVVLKGLGLGLSLTGNMPADVSPDGRFMVFSKTDDKLQSDLLILDLQGSREPGPFIATPFQDSAARFSADGRWVAYSSNETGTPQVYVQPFEQGQPAQGTRWQASTKVGSYPVWRADGKELFYAADSKVTAVSVQINGNVLKFGEPVALFSYDGFPGSFDVAPDGQRFLLVEAADVKSMPMTVVVNWQAKVKR